MKTRLRYLFSALACLAFSALNSQVSTAHAQGTAFRYQGHLNDGANPANGSYDLTFSLFDASSGGSQFGSTLTYTAVGVADGLFSVTADFGAVFNGTAYWLQIGVRTNGSTKFTTLKPLQELTPVPYAITAENLTGVLPLAQLPAGVLTNNEASVTFGNVAIGGNLTLPATATISSGGNSLLAGLSVDPKNLNVGNITAHALTFGTASGEGLASKRSGANAYDLEFYTDFINRMTISQNGNVGINTTTPTEGLEINGTSRIDDNDMYLRTGTDHNHGLGYRSWADGPFLYGFSGGALGTENPEHYALSWDPQGNVVVINNLSVYGGMFMDQNAKNIGNVNSNALVFGGTYGSTGEGIASKRSGTNPYNLEFYTGFNNRMTIANNGHVGINATSPTETLEINGTSRIDDNDMYLRTGTDHNHGLGYRASVSGTGVDGPLLYGYSGGALGTSNPESIALSWDRNGDAYVSNNLSVNNNLSINGALKVTGAGANTTTAAFIQVVTQANLAQHGFGVVATEIDNPICNGNNNAILLITPNVSRLQNNFTDPVAVVFVYPYWYIVNQADNALSVGQAFNVLVVVP